MVQAHRDGTVASASRPRLDSVPHGTGDLFAGVLAAGIAKDIRPAAGLGFAVAAVEKVIAASGGSPSLNLAQGLRDVEDVVPCEVTADG
jgi:pyridoxal/pyridoxine/pyridoxamine kinase